jgi:hypothetical protein
MKYVPGSERTLKMLVNCKTYTVVSERYTETVCTGGIEPDGNKDFGEGGHMSSFGKRVDMDF